MSEKDQALSLDAVSCSFTCKKIHKDQIAVTQCMQIAHTVTVNH